MQDRLYDFSQGAWLVDAHASLPRLIFRTGPMLFSIAVGLVLFSMLLVPARWWPALRRRVARRAVLCALLTLVTLPLFVAAGKQVTNRFCPAQLLRYGGDIHYVGMFEPNAATNPPGRQGECFPAAHACGGFGLVGLMALLRRRRTRLGVMACAFAIGWIAGGYQMITGAHFLSHTLVTMILAWIMFLTWRRVFGLPAIEQAEEASARSVPEPRLPERKSPRYRGEPESVPEKEESLAALNDRTR